MAQQVKVAGALFENVPIIKVPDVNDVFHDFVDTSDANATASDIAQGKTAYVNGEKVTGTASGGGGGSSADLKALIERTAITLELPSDLETIGASAFVKCESLALTSLPSGVTSIGSQAFTGCSALALTSLPSGMTSIGSYAFQSCANLALTNLPSGITSIETYTFSGCSSLALTSLPSGVTAIKDNSFRNCTGIVSISCTGAIATLGSNAFYGCSNLVSASFPNAVASTIGTMFGNSTAANACQKLEFADVGKTQELAANAFSNCYKLQTLVLRRTGAVCSLANVNAFLNTPMRGYNSLRGTVYVPSNLVDTYKTATNWKTLYNNGTVSFAAIEGSAYEL